MTEHDTFAEPPERREAFNRYARMEPRSLRRLAAELKIAKSTVEQWSTDGKWQERIERWDIAATVGDYEQWIKEAHKRRAEKRAVAEGVLVKALEGLKALPAKALKAGDVVRFVRLAEDLLDQVVEDGRPTDPRDLEALTRDVADDAAIDEELAIRDVAAFDAESD